MSAQLARLIPARVEGTDTHVLLRWSMLHEATVSLSMRVPGQERAVWEWPVPRFELSSATHFPQHPAGCLTVARPFGDSGRWWTELLLQSTTATASVLLSTWHLRRVLGKCLDARADMTVLGDMLWRDAA